MRKKKKKRSISLVGISQVIALGVLITTTLGLLGRFNWFFDLFSHFRVQYLQICLIPFIIALWKRKNRLALALVMLVCFNYIFVLPLYFGKPDPAETQPIRVLLINLNAGNGHTQQVLKAIEAVQPDILLLAEVTPKWSTELTALNERYPYRIEEPQDGCFGIMLLSTYPLEHGQVVEIGPAGVPSIIADAYLPEGVVSIIATHPLPPIGAEYARLRNAQLAELPGYVKKQKHPVLLMGDLNTTPWSFHFRQLITNSGLKNSMQGFGHQPSWPKDNFFLRIPLDHVLHSPEISIHHRAILGDIGSDHFPVMVDFSVE